MILQEDAIVDIPPNRVKYFGTTGKMLLPSPATIAAVIQKIPRSKIITTTLLRQQLTEQFEVEGTCPVTTKRSLQAVARQQPDNVPYWRVVQQNGGLMAYYPGGAERQAALLRNEGVSIDMNGKALRVSNHKERIANFN